MKCSVCGNVIPENTNECAVCGTPVEEGLQSKTAIDTLTEKRSQLLIISTISLVILAFLFLIDLTNYSDYSTVPPEWFSGLKVLGIFGLIFTLINFFGIIFLIVVTILEIFKSKIKGYNKFSTKVPMIGLITHSVIVFFTSILMLWEAVFFESAAAFFTPMVTVFGLQIISIWLFYIAVRPKNIFGKVEKVEE